MDEERQSQNHRRAPQRSGTVKLKTLTDKHGCGSIQPDELPQFRENIAALLEPGGILCDDAT